MPHPSTILAELERQEAVEQVARHTDRDAELDRLTVALHRAAAHPDYEYRWGARPDDSTDWERNTHSETVVHDKEVEAWMRRRNRDRDRNRNAEFLPQRNDDELPAIRIGAALVFTYWKDGVLRVSIDTSDVAAEHPDLVDNPEVGCAVRVDVENDTVHERARS